MMNWYKLSPVDTLFFRGAEPMIMGESHTVSQLFPPPAQTIAGAVRTAVLVQNNISFDDYANGNVPQNIPNAIGKAGEDAPFNLIGPLFMIDNEICIPAPYSWFMEKEDQGNEEVKIFKCKPLKSRLIKTDSPQIYWAKGERGELVSLGGMWVKLSDIYSENGKIPVKSSGDFFVFEQRTGVALHENRKVRDGHLYSFNHARLAQNVSMVFGIDKNLPFAESGVLKIGAEQRFGGYEKLPASIISFKETGELFLSLSVIAGSEEVNNAVIATGKIQYLGGWDLTKGFHKPMKGYFPPGSVFSKKLNNNFIAIQGE